MDSLTEAYEERNRDTGLQRLFPFLGSTGNGPAGRETTRETTRGTTGGDSRGTTRVATHEATRGNNREATKGSSRGTTHETTRWTTHAVTRGTAQEATRGTAQEATREGSRQQRPGSVLRWAWFSAPSLRHYVVGGLLAFGIVLDAVATDALLGGGGVREGNQLMGAAYGLAGVLGVLGVKVAIVALGVVVLRLALDRRWAERMTFWFYAICGTGWTLAGLWNVLIGALFLVL